MQHLRIFLQRLLGILAALAQAFAFIGKPGATLLNYPIVRRQIQQIAYARDAFAVHDVELGFAERRRDFVLGHLHLRAIADDAIAVFDRANTANVEAQAGIEFQRAAAGCGLGIAEHHADLFANLIDEDKAGVRLGHDRRQLAKCLRHQTRLQSRQRIAHLAIQFSARHQRRH